MLAFAEHEGFARKLLFAAAQNFGEQVAGQRPDEGHAFAARDSGSLDSFQAGETSVARQAHHEPWKQVSVLRQRFSSPDEGGSLQTLPHACSLVKHPGNAAGLRTRNDHDVSAWLPHQAADTFEDSLLAVNLL
ncbi:MAG: hypothetical protein ACYC2H_08575 [Thermoplasmatota archaeon]